LKNLQWGQSLVSLAKTYPLQEAADAFAISLDVPRLG
jgi:hypothetical protein